MSQVGKDSFDRNKVINLALAEEGYLEKSRSAVERDPSVIYKKKEGAGYDNITKYGREMHALYPAIMDPDTYWCDAFVDDMFHVAYDVDNATGLVKIYSKKLLGGDWNDYTVASADLYDKKGALDRNPEKGAQIFFSKDGKKSGIFHTGLVYKVTTRRVYTVEGNTSSSSNVVANGGAVRKKSYSRSSSYIKRAFFGHPLYNDESVIKIKEIKKASEKTYLVTFEKNGKPYPVHDVSYGDQGAVVLFMQQMLNAAFRKAGHEDWVIEEDGKCYDGTCQAIARFQLLHNGIRCGKGTWTALLAKETT